MVFHVNMGWVYGRANAGIALDYTSCAYHGSICWGVDITHDIYARNDTGPESEGFLKPSGMVVQRQGKYLNITFENARQMTTIQASDAQWIRWAAEIRERAENVARERREPM